jgi:phage gpG-like protein
MSEFTAEVLGSEALVARLSGNRDALATNLRRAVMRLAITVQSDVKDNKLTGQVLKVRTGTLRRSINQRVDESDEGVLATVGTNVSYAGVHEYGYQGTVSVPAHTRGGHSVRAYAMRMNLPPRSYLRSTLAELRDSLRRVVQESLQ